MLIKKIEYHTVHSHFDYDIPDEDIIAEFGSVEKFEEAFADETDEFFEFIEDYDYDRDDDWFSDRKGGYEIEWSFVEE